MQPQKIYDFFTYTEEIPPTFGKLHLTVIFLTILTTIILTLTLKNASEKAVRLTLFGAWIILITLEAYRQIAFSIELVDGQLGWEYAWDQLSLQICSVQLYAIPMIVFLKDGKLRDAFICVMMVWSLIGGIGVTLYPGNTLSYYFGVSLQSMIHHGIQVVLGIALTFRYADRMNIRHFFRGFVLFNVYTFIAMCANIHVYEHLLIHVGGGINMFALSPYGEPLIKVLDTIRDLTSHRVMTFVFLSCLTLLAIFLYWLEFCFTKGRRKKLKRYN